MKYFQTLTVYILIFLAMNGCATYDSMTDQNINQMTASEIDSYCFNFYRYSTAVKKHSLESVRWKPLFISEDNLKISEITLDAYRDLKNDSVIDTNIPDLLDKIRQELSEHERELDQIVASHGHCYGVGYNGQEYKKIIESSQKSIVDFYGRIERTENEYIKSLSLVKNRASLYAKNREFLIYDNEQIYLEIENIEVKNIDTYYATTEINLFVQSKENNKYLYPIDSEIWGYDVNPDLVGSFPVWVSLTDAVGNSFKIKKFTSEFYGNGKGIGPSQRLKFKLIFSNHPVNNSQYATLEFKEGTFGQKDNITLKLPFDLFTNDENIREHHYTSN